MTKTELHDAHIAVPEGTLEGILAIPPDALGVVVFAHGSGSSRFSTRNTFVAQELQAAGLATLLMDLLTEEEERVDRITSHLRFDVELLGRRVLAAIDWLHRTPVRGLPIGVFGASTGAAAALIAAAENPREVAAVVSRGGRPDLAGDALEEVRAPTLLLVGGLDYGVIELNQEAYDRLSAPKELAIVPGATHLFEEPGTLERVARRAADWFSRWLAGIERGERRPSAAGERRSETPSFV